MVIIGLGLGWGHTIRKLLLEDIATQHGHLLTASLTDGPRQASLQRGDVLLQIVTIQAETRLQTKAAFNPIQPTDPHGHPTRATSPTPPFRL